MKTLTQEIWMNVPQRRAIISIHDKVERLVEKSDIPEGLVLIKAWVPTTAAVLRIMSLRPGDAGSI